MNHQEIEENEIIERYLLHQLAADERRAFQEHYFSCDECFEKAQMEARFIAGVRDESRSGAFAKSAFATSTAAPAASWPGWLKPAFTLAAAASLVMAIALGWLLLDQIPKLRGELARERQAREQVEREQQQSLNRAREEAESERRKVEIERNERAKLQSQVEELARNQTWQSSNSKTAAQANVPIVVLEAVRDSQSGANQIHLPADANHLTLWQEVEPGNRFDSFQLQIFDASNRQVQTIRGLKANSYGALAASVSAKAFQTGKYLVKLYGVKGQQRELVGEYDLNVRR
jgi:anti-sigma factor RsiW